MPIRQKFEGCLTSQSRVPAGAVPSSARSVQTMSNRTYICLDCRTAKRAPAAYGLNTAYRCSQCRGPLRELPWRWKIPRKRKDSEWKQLKEMAIEREAIWLPKREAEGKALLQKLDRQIAAVSDQRDSDSKEKKLRYLRRQRHYVEKKYKEHEDPNRPADAVD